MYAAVYHHHITRRVIHIAAGPWRSHAVTDGEAVSTHCETEWYPGLDLESDDLERNFEVDSETVQLAGQVFL